MIFVTIGTAEPFDRLLRALDALPRTEELVVQRGASSVTLGGARCVDFLPYEQVVAHIRVARAVIMHAGAGSIITCLAHGKSPIVVPRLARYGETCDDHQLAFARRLAESGVVTLVEELEQLPEAVANGHAKAAAAVEGNGGLARELREYLASTVAEA